MAVHHLHPTRSSLHGHWSRDLEPALVIDSGDAVRFSTLDALWCDGRPNQPWPWRRFEPRDPVLDEGHALTGPVLVRGAMAGMTLEVRIGHILPDEWGWTWSWPQDQRARSLGLLEGPPFGTLWNIDAAGMTATDQKGRSLALRPFMGVMGVAPPDSGMHATTPPRVWGGNLDCRELVAGTTLFLPIGVDGALFSVGDGHAAQGDGEVSGTALECPMREVELTFSVRPDLHLQRPRARTTSGWITMGFGQTLDQAMIAALGDMLDLIQQTLDVGRSEALAIASISADLRITQIVNQVQGVHCVWDEKKIRHAGT